MFNCDGEFDFKSMGRIFMGLCKCGAWGCFDEFNRLEENVLSAVSQQIQIIQASTLAVVGYPSCGQRVYCCHMTCSRGGKHRGQSAQ